MADRIIDVQLTKYNFYIYLFIVIDPGISFGTNEVVSYLNISLMLVVLPTK